VTVTIPEVFAQPFARLVGFSEVKQVLGLDVESFSQVLNVLKGWSVDAALNERHEVNAVPIRAVNISWLQFR
jgi:hypothetical protein